MTTELKTEFELNQNKRNPFDSEYHKLLSKILNSGEDRGDRTGTGTRSLFGEKMEFDLRKGFPLSTTKRVFWKGVVEELLWFLKGSTNSRELEAAGVNIWKDWSDENGDLGPVYGAQWVNWNNTGINQIEDIIQRITKTPECRRIILSSWNVEALPKMALMPCHMTAQFYVSRGKYLNCQMYQRSADMFLGVPFNFSSYSLLTHMIAQVTGLKAGKFTHILGDAHIYRNHFTQVETQLSRQSYAPPTIKLNPNIKNIFDFKSEDIKLIDYKCHKTIKAPISV